jgi:uncharacterized protein (DUF1800 family)
MALVHFAPYVPGQDSPWDAKATIKHLLRRSGFGAPPEDVERLIQQVNDQGLEAPVRDLFDDAPDQEAEYQQTFDRIKVYLLDFSDLTNFQTWWCYRLMRTRTPLKEKLTLFWHGHFATSYAKVQEPYLMHRQNDTLRAHAWGNFRDLVWAVSRDPAMLIYLDGESNTKDHPNENFARELMELFTLGIGHYTEKDVREAARAFTGWSREGAEFRLNTDQHDAGVKEFLGHSGPFTGTHIIDILMEQPALARFLARKLLVFFACPEPPEEVVAEAGEVLKTGGLNIKYFLNALFLSRFFYSPACRYTRITSPAECVVGTCRSLGIRLSGPQVRDNLTAMSQEFFAPPSVKGWDGEKKWINSNTWMARTTFAQQLVDLPDLGDLSPHLDLGRLIPAELVAPAQIVDLLTEQLLEGRLPPGKRAELAQFLITKDDKQPDLETFRKDADFRTVNTRNVIKMLLSLPEYHTC